MEDTMKTDNELIAEFMGMKYRRGYGPLSGETYDEVKQTPSANWQNAYFHKSWDWLMPVVQAIEDLEEPHPSNDPTKGSVWPYHVEILSRSVVQIIDNRTDEDIVTIDDQDHRKIDSVYKAVVAFIKWYNSINSTTLNNGKE